MKKGSNQYIALTCWQDFRLKLFFESIAVGLFAGMIVISYRYLLSYANILRSEVYTFLRSSGVIAVAIWFVFLVTVSYILGRIVEKQPMVSGSGIPQVKGILLNRIKTDWLRIIVWKFIGGVLAIGAGLSLGREGPSVQLGAGVGQGISRMLRRLKIEEKYLITSGASAGLAAAFNAPLAGVIFSLEEIHKNFSPQVLTAAMAASVTADFIANKFLGHRTVFEFSALPVMPLDHYPYLIFLGLVIGVFGAAFNSCLLKTLDIYEAQNWLPARLKPVIALVMAGVLGFILPEVLGGGNALINQISRQAFPLSALVIIVAAKFVFTMVSYGSGVPGGIFLPLLVIGAVAGNIMGIMFVQLFGINPVYINNFIVLAMAGYFTAIVKAPITGTILITEMTGSFSHLLALTTVSMTAYLVTDLLKSKPVYDLLLERMLASRDSAVSTGNAKENTLLETAVCMGSALDGKRVRDVHWPAGCLLVSVKRGARETIPCGDTRIYPGDYLIVLVNDGQAAIAKQLLLDMAQERLEQSCLRMMDEHTASP